MWTTSIYQSALIVRQVNGNLFRANLRCIQRITAIKPAKCSMCTAAKSSAISMPDQIKYPNGDKRLKDYLDKLKAEQSAKHRVDSVVLATVLQHYERRLSIVEQYNELLNEMSGNTDEGIVALANEEKQQFNEMLTEIDDELVDHVIQLSDIDEEGVSSLMLEIQAGVGGQEAMLFARELATLYENYINFKGWQHNVTEEEGTGIGGIRNFSILVHGHSAFDVLKYEAGVHRVQRVPKTERGGRTHTSTAVVLIVPCADQIDVKLNPNDLRVETKRSSGPGGQNVNKLESAVRIVHIPTGLAVECQEERTQIKNKQIAMKKLYNQLYHIEFTKQASSQRNMRKLQTGTRTRNEKLRTYNYPQSRITDHRMTGGTGTIHNLEEFLRGTEYFDAFILKLNKFMQRQRLNDILDRTL